jgi:hypothetical protein
MRKCRIREVDQFAPKKAPSMQLEWSLFLDLVPEVLLVKKYYLLRAPVAHACNPSYSGGSDMEDHSTKPAQPNNS